MATTKAAPGHRSAAGTAPARLVLDSPIGRLLLAGDDRALTHLLLPNAVGALGSTRECTGPVAAAAAQLDEYFAGTRTSFDVPLAPDGTPFRRAVWAALVEIPYGETISYAELAREVGRPGAYRAVGQANGSNPIAIVVPCHRVVAAGGGLGGYGGGLDVKRALLDLEAGG
jgi:methylated-DNA-[protein]-cysteine S-methyltransferase